MKNLLSFLRCHFVPTAIGLIGLYVFAVLIIKSFCNWNFPAESVFFDFVNYFWRENFRMFVIPHFEWHSDYFLYPYGCDITFIFWGFEMNIFGTLFYSVFGDGPWGQWYYLYSLFVTYFGVYAMLVVRKGRGWAVLFAFALTFCNYAAICKFPGHSNHSVIHWSIISVLFDVVTVEKFWQESRFTVRFVLARILVLLLCFGLELGYVAGFACFSFFVTCVYLFCAATLRKCSVCAVAKTFLPRVGRFLCSLREATWTSIFLLCVIFVVAWTYLPIIAQIVLNTPTEASTGVWETNPLRIFLPIFPGWNAATTFNTPGVMGEKTIDTIYAWNAGWSALILFVAGIVIGGRRNAKMWVPFVVILSLVMLMKWIPYVRLFPAFKYSRIPERFSLYLLLILLVPFYFSCKDVFRRITANRRSWRAIWVVAVVVIIWAVEIVTAYSGTFLWLRKYPLSKFSDDYVVAAQKIRTLPGEALFFMPFSAHGGDGRGLADFHQLTAYQMQFTAKCGKKMNGIYLGRMPDDLYLRDFANMNWRSYFGNAVWSKRQWDNLEKFFCNSDFCAAVVATNILSPAQYADIVVHLGEPIAKFAIFDTTYEVIPMPARLRGRKNIEAICGDIFNYNLVSTTAQHFADKEAPALLVSGFSEIEPWGVWSNAKSCELRFSVPQSANPVRIVFNAMAFPNMKTVAVYCGEQKLANWDIAVPPMTPADYAIVVPPELTGRVTELRFELHDPARPCDLGMNEDGRMLGLGLISIRREAVQE